MENENAAIRQLVGRAVGASFDSWAAEHPSLAAAIDRCRLEQQVVSNLRDTPEYRAAVEAYQQSRSQTELLENLSAAAGRVLGRLLTG